jgi:hypothetical protein
MLDMILRGVGIQGAMVAALKNTAVAYKAQKDKPMPNFAQPILSLASISPPAGSMLRDINTMMTNEKYMKTVIESKGYAYDSPRWHTIGLGAKAFAKFPGIDWTFKKIAITKLILEENGTVPQDVMLALGWNAYNLGLENQEHIQIKMDAAAKKKFEDSIGKQLNKELLKSMAEFELNNRSPKQIAEDMHKARKAAKVKAAKTKATKDKNKSAKVKALYEAALKTKGK